MEKKLWLSGLIILAFLLLTLSVSLYVSKTRELRRLDPLELESMTKDQILQLIYQRQAQSGLPNLYFIPIFAFFGLVVGALTYFLLSNDLEKKEAALEYNGAVILQLLGQDERKAVERIVELGGSTHQVEITYLPGFTKVKAHRVVESLVAKAILEKETRGKMRLLKLHPELYAMLRDT
jgi:hypothetical protein